MCMGITDEESSHLQTQHCESAILQKKQTLSLKKKKHTHTRINETQVSGICQTKARTRGNPKALVILVTGVGQEGILSPCEMMRWKC